MSESQENIQPSPKTATGRSARELVKVLVALMALGGAAYYVYRQLHPVDAYRLVAFKDHAQSNVPLDSDDVGGLQFVDTSGNPVELAQYRGRSNVVLVVTRGNTTRSERGPYVGNICLYCATQTSRLIANYKDFQDRSAEVVVVFPIKRAAESDTLGQFQVAVTGNGAVAPPFPLVLDIELRAVDQLGIRADLARPATYILDKQGQVRFAYVGATIADRPSIQSMLDQLDAVNAEAN